MCVINSPKYIGIMENYLCIHGVRKVPRSYGSGCDISLSKIIHESSAFQMFIISHIYKLSFTFFHHSEHIALLDIKCKINK